MNKNVTKLLAGAADDRVKPMVARASSMGYGYSQHTELIARTFRYDSDVKVQTGCFFNREVGDYFLDKLVNITGSTEQELIEMKQSFWKDCEYVVPNDVLHDTKKLMSLLEKMVESADSLTTILVFRVNTTHDIDITLTEIGNELLDKFYSIRFVVELSGIYEHFDFMEYPNTWSSDKEFALFSIIKYAYDLPNTEVGIVISVNTMNILHILDLIWFLKERLDIDIKFSISNIDIVPLESEIVDYINAQYTAFYNDYRKVWTDSDNSIKLLLAEISEDLNTTIDTDKMAMLQFKKDIVLQGDKQVQYWKDYFPELKRILEYADTLQITDTTVTLSNVEKKKKKVKK